MASPFDNIQKETFRVVESTFGVPAVWSPSTGEPSQNATVLFNDPSQGWKIGALARGGGLVEYDPNQYTIEYKWTDFVGLKDAADSGLIEVVSVDSVDYYVRKVDKIFDGKTYKAILEPVQP